MFACTAPDLEPPVRQRAPERRLTPPGAATSDVLTPVQRRVVVGAIAGLHVLAVWGLLQVRAVREAAIEAAPILVSLLRAPVPPTPPPPAPAPAPAPKPTPRARIQPAPPPPVLATAASPAPEAVSVPPPPDVPAPPAPPLPAAPSVVTATPAVAAAPPPAMPKVLPDDAVQYLRAPQVVYPPLSLRRRETGLVVVRAYVGTEGGTPRSVLIEQSSGHARLDQAALAAVQSARFRPYAEKGRPVEGWALIPIRFQLEK